MPDPHGIEVNDRVFCPRRGLGRVKDVWQDGGHTGYPGSDWFARVMWDQPAPGRPRSTVRLTRTLETVVDNG